MIESAKASSRNGRFGRTLDVLRARVNIGEEAGDFQLYRAANGAMLAAVRRDRSQQPDSGFIGGPPYAWDLRSYAEGE